ncbi:hypothetical protein GC169_04110 [bacterium]|nr:hypothetical protein [bacterium]
MLSRRNLAVGVSASVVALAWAAFAPGSSPAYAQASPSRLESAVTPLIRTVTPGTTATAFGVISNSGTTTLTNCRPVADPLALASSQVTFSYQTTNASNQLTGTTDTAATLTPGASQNFLLRFTTPSGGESSVDPRISFRCNEATAPTRNGVNTFQLAWANSAPDIIPIVVTLSGDGVVRVANPGGVQALPAAAVNIGAAGNILVTPTTFLGDLSPAVTATICETNPTTGQCTNPSTPGGYVLAAFAQNQSRTFTVFFDQFDTVGTPFMPDVVRVGMDFYSYTTSPICTVGGQDFIFGNIQLRGQSGAAFTSPDPSQGPTLQDGYYDFVFDDIATRGRSTAFGLFFSSVNRLYASAFGAGDRGGAFVESQESFGSSFIDAIRSSSPSPDVFADARIVTQEIATTGSGGVFNRNQSALLGANVQARHQFAGRAVAGSGATPIPAAREADFRSLFLPFGDETITLAEYDGAYSVLGQQGGTTMNLASSGGQFTISGSIPGGAPGACTFTGTVTPRPGNRQPMVTSITFTSPAGASCATEWPSGTYDGYSQMSPPTAAIPQCNLPAVPRFVQVELSPLRRGATRSTDTGAEKSLAGTRAN